ncbi:MAG: LytTR family DNA-binding domain-containing protein [Acidobacteriota bacterium]
MSGNTQAICDSSLAGLLDRLDPESFKQFHRNNLVCIAHIQALTTTIQGEMFIELANRMRLPVSRKHRRDARELLKSISK